MSERTPPGLAGLRAPGLARRAADHGPGAARDDTVARSCAMRSARQRCARPDADLGPSSRLGSAVAGARLAGDGPCAAPHGWAASGAGSNVAFVQMWMFAGHATELVGPAVADPVGRARAPRGPGRERSPTRLAAYSTVSGSTVERSIRSPTTTRRAHLVLSRLVDDS